MNQPDAPVLAGVHHLKLPVTDLARSREWYRSRLGYQVRIEFVEHGRLMGYVLAHPNGGPVLGLRLSPERALAAAGFDYFAIGVPDQDAIVQLAARLSALGEQHAGVHWATIGWILPGLHDPDGHEVRFYTLQEHTDLPPGAVTTINDPRESAQRRERAGIGQSALPSRAAADPRALPVCGGHRGVSKARPAIPRAAGDHQPGPRDSITIPAHPHG